MADQLYASNPQQDLALFDEIVQQMAEFKIDLIESWFEDQPLAGGAEEKIAEMRAIPVKDRSALLAQTAPHANIRATGHGWCIRRSGAIRDDTLPWMQQLSY